MLKKILNSMGGNPTNHEFQKNGFLIKRGLINSLEITRLTEKLKNRYLGDNDKNLENDLANNTPELVDYISDNRILKFVRSAIGQDIKFLQSSDLHFNHNVNGWHRDSVSRDYGGVDWSRDFGEYKCVKIIVYLECSNFGLAVIPGSHQNPVNLEDLNSFEARPVFIQEKEKSRIFDFDDQNWDIVVPLMEPGDAIVFDERLFHKGYPLNEIDEKRKKHLRENSVSKFTENKATFCFTFGPDNIHSDRFYSNFRYFRRDLKYKDLSVDIMDKLKRKKLLLNSLGTNVFEKNKIAAGDLYNPDRNKLAEGENLSNAMQTKDFQINPKDLTDEIKLEYKTRKSFENFDIQCPSCSSRDGVLATNYPDKRQWFFVNLLVVSCRGCGLSWVPNKPFGLSEYYSTSYSDTKGRESEVEPDQLFSDEILLKSMGISRSRRHLKTIKTYKPNIETVVDFGCGYGLTLSLFDGVKKIGVEVDPKVAKYAKTRGVSVVSNTTELEDGVADVIISSHSLEHVPMVELSESLRELRRVMKQDGIGLIEVPNVPLLRLNVSKLRHAPHLNFFSKKSLENLLLSAGFKVVDLFGGGTGERPLRRHQYYKPENADDDVRNGALVAIISK